MNKPATDLMNTTLAFRVIPLKQLNTGVGGHRGTLEWPLLSHVLLLYIVGLTSQWWHQRMFHGHCVVLPVIIQYLLGVLGSRGGFSTFLPLPGDTHDYTTKAIASIA